MGNDNSLAVWQSLQAANNQLERLELPCSRSLRELTASHNLLPALPPLAELPALATLDVSHNKIRSIQSADVQAWPSACEAVCSHSVVFTAHDSQPSIRSRLCIAICSQPSVPHYSQPSDHRHLFTAI